MFEKWIAWYKQRSLDKAHKAGYNYAAGAWLSGEKTPEELDNLSDNSNTFNTTGTARAFDEGIRAAMRTIYNRENVVKAYSEPTIKDSSIIHQSTEYLIYEVYKLVGGGWRKRHTLGVFFDRKRAEDLAHDERARVQEMSVVKINQNWHSIFRSPITGLDENEYRPMRRGDEKRATRRAPKRK